MVRHVLASALTLLVLATVAACGGGGAAPELAPIEDKIVAVGQELSVELIGTDADGDDLDYSFASDVPDLGDRATMTKNAQGHGVFRWRPLAADVNQWHFDFTVSDGDHDTTLPVLIEVKSAIGDQTVPVFRQPLGTGTTLDLELRPCLDLDIVVEDQDSTDVTIEQIEPIIEGAELTQTTQFTATWHWCPSRAQLGTDEPYTLTLSADDRENPPTIKNYLIVLRSPQQNCPGAGPVVVHTPMNVSQLVDLTIDARVTDDLGLGQPPLLYWSATPPANPPDLAMMQQVTMLHISGDVRDGVWAADVPNPVATMPTGSMATVYYVIVATDDDASGTCDHETIAPATGSYQTRVTNPGGQGNLGVCETCSADVQCGGASDNCVHVGNGDFCLESCQVQGDCPANYTCPTAPVTSVGGVMARQCQPLSGSCTMMQACTDDSAENNDTRAQANTLPALSTGAHSYVSCPLADGSNDDEDWFKFVVAADSSVTMALAGMATSDLDLAIYDSAGVRLAAATGSTSTETLTQCLVPGTYFARVYAFGAGAMNAYSLTYTRSAMACPVACTDDAAEQDDDAAHARSITYPTYTSTMNQICTDDDDWFKVLMFDGEVATADLTFTQATAAQDLDVHWFNAAGTDLTPCSPADSSTCNLANGQSADANERFTFTAPAACSDLCTYYLVVRGWDGATNRYDLTIRVP
jgi:hypothetical protein